ncbi:Tissue alpha-L-fucosidase [Sarcoptes scabiei]|uniref:Putative alpha-L-fucosidase n=1 Tax=Sarcoptes scabiei TaxID=52283 RepID=A0A834RAE3_SARSC|nr:Tissue alpha-L-fucosidase [Sarcoptes scabiei]
MFATSIIRLIVLLLFVFNVFAVNKIVSNQNGIKSHRYEPNWKSLDKRPLPSWFDESKIGIFIHWGVFSVPSYGSEWFWEHWKQKDFNITYFMMKNYRPGFTYADFANDFRAEFFDPEEWADIFKRSGARYVVLTSKHHEGYTLWPSKHSFQWNAEALGPGRDLVGELAHAVRGEGLRFGLYHSLFEWFNPLYLNDKANGFKTNEFVRNKVGPCLYELIDRYRPSLIWSDGEWDAPDTYWNSTNFLAWLYNESPVKDEIVVNDRWGHETLCKHGGYYTCQDRYNPKTLQGHKWENAMTLDQSSWGYRREASLSDILGPEKLIATLVETVSCGGNLLVNVGPTKYGKLTPIFEERLYQLGEWLQINGEAIYGSKPWTKQNDSITSNVWFTSNHQALYAILLNYPKDNQLILGSVPYHQVSLIKLLGTEKPCQFNRTSEDYTFIRLPPITPNDQVKYAYTLKILLKESERNENRSNNAFKSGQF